MDHHPLTHQDDQPALHQDPDPETQVEETKLPSELLFIIFAIAASTSRQAAYSLAFVSHSISAFTSILRWRSISLTTERQVLAFWQILLTYHENQQQEQDDKSQREEVEEKAFEKPAIKFPDLSWDLKNSISLPKNGSVNPGKFVENLFIELEEDRFLTLSTRLQNQRERYSKALVEVLNELDNEKNRNPSTSKSEDYSLSDDIYSIQELSSTSNNHSWSQLQKIKLSPTKPQSRLSGLFYHLPNIQVLSLGSIELSVLSKSLHSISPTELTLVFDGDENNLGQVLTWGSGTLPEEIEWRNGSIAGRRIPSLGGLRKKLTKLHVIGIDPRSQAPGLQMPYHLISPLRAGSLFRGSLIHAIMEECKSRKDKVQSELQDFLSGEMDSSSGEHRENSLDEETESTVSSNVNTSTGITHLRYDTRKFSFRPAEIIVSRLRCFLQEVKPSNQSEETNEILKSWGLGTFTRLHLSWDVENVDDVKKSRFSSSNVNGKEEEIANRKLNGGWPREIKDTWTERSDRDLSPTFSHELSHCFQQAYGWQPIQTNKSSSSPSTSLKSQSESIKSQDSVATFVPDNSGEMGSRLSGNGIDEETELLRSLETSVGVELASDSLKRMNREEIEFKTLEETKPDLRYGVRSPARLLRLGGKAALSRESRLRLFEDRSSGGNGAW